MLCYIQMNFHWQSCKNIKNIMCMCVTNILANSSTNSALVWHFTTWPVRDRSGIFRTGLITVSFQMLFDLDTSSVSRGCTSAFDQQASSCVNEERSGRYANGKCEFCCSGDRCNAREVTSRDCIDIRDSSAEGLKATHLMWFCLLCVLVWCLP